MPTSTGSSPATGRENWSNNILGGSPGNPMYITTSGSVAGLAIDTQNNVQQTVLEPLSGTQHGLSTDFGGFRNSGSTKNALGRIFQIHGYNGTGGTLIFMTFNSSSIPKEGDASPVDMVAVPTISSFSIDYGYWGITHLSGIAWSWSTASGSLATPATNLCRVTLQYK